MLILLNDKGSLDMMVQRSGLEGQGNILFVQNNFYFDAFFLKAIGAYHFIPSLNNYMLIRRIVMNGACNSGWCTNPNTSEKYHV